MKTLVVIDITTGFYTYNAQVTLSHFFRRF